MKILIVGGGGREHALAWKLAQSPKVTKFYVAPGNAGTAAVAENVPAETTEEIISWVKQNTVHMVVVGPDSSLAEGLVDQLHALSVPVFGPTQAAAKIEWSKAYAKEFMKAEGIPTATYEVFSELDAALAYSKTASFPLVIKASGLALGKGVVIAHTEEEARTVLCDMMQAHVFGVAGEEVVIEEFLEGREISVHAFCDGTKAVLFPAAQDHKRIGENDEGPNTGGMGTVAPVPFVTSEIMAEIDAVVIRPTLAALARRGTPFVGVLFPGIMLTAAGPKVIEYNARFGDPETQSYMRLLQTDLVDILLACISGTLEDLAIRWAPQTACCVVCASAGYPASYQVGKPVRTLDGVPKEVVIFHAATKQVDGQVVTNGGRVLGVTAVSDSLQHSLESAYAAIEHIQFEGKTFRKDIGAKSN